MNSQREFTLLELIINEPLVNMHVPPLARGSKFILLLL